MHTIITTTSLYRTSLIKSVGIIALAICIALTPECNASVPFHKKADDNCEKVFVHFDKSVYVAGEYLDYKVYLMNGREGIQTPYSKILYFSLSGLGSKKAIQWRINMSSYMAHGSYKLPADLSEGVYELKAYTNSMRNSPAQCLFTWKVLILNLAKETTDTILLRDSDLMDASDTLSHHDAGNHPDMIDQPWIQVTLTKSDYDHKEIIRAEIMGNINAKKDTVHFSLSVTRTSSVTKLLNNTGIVEQFRRLARPENIRNNCLFGLEDKGYILTGKIRNREDNLPINDAKVLLGVADSIASRLLYAETDSAGSFCFYLKKAYDNREIILQLADYTDNSQIIWKLDRKNEDSQAYTLTRYGLQAEQKTFLNSTKDIRLIEAVYTDEQNAGAVLPVAFGTGYFDEPDLVVYPADYAELANFKEIDENILPLVRFINRGDRQGIEIYNAWLGLWNENNLLLLNGIPFNDLDYISVLGTSEIKRIEIYTSDYLVGNLTYHGMISICTYDNKIPENYVKRNAMVYLNSVVAGGDQAKRDLIPDDNQTGNHFPDFRDNLLWEPYLSTVGDKKLMVEFPASRLAGDYQIFIYGVTTSGIPVSTSAFFHVKQE